MGGPGSDQLTALVTPPAAAGESHAATYLEEVTAIVRLLDPREFEAMARALATLRASGGRLFFLGVGGSAANASHATNDFRKIAGIECYCATDNVAELTARTNDEGWQSTFVEYLRGSRLRQGDGVFVFSVGGGDEARNVSANLVHALQHAAAVGATIFGVVGRDGGFTAGVAHHCVIIPEVSERAVTPHTEAFQAVAWHLLVTHPLLQTNAMKWESVAP